MSGLASEWIEIYLVCVICMTVPMFRLMIGGIPLGVSVKSTLSLALLSSFAPPASVITIAIVNSNN